MYVICYIDHSYILNGSARIRFIDDSMMLSYTLFLNALIECHSFVINHKSQLVDQKTAKKNHRVRMRRFFFWPNEIVGIYYLALHLVHP